MTESNEKELEKARRLIQGVKNNPSVATRIAPVYGETDIDAGISLLELTTESFAKQKKEQHESEAKSQELDNALDEIDTFHKRLRKMGRYMSEANSPESKACNFRGEIPTNFAEWKPYVAQTFNGLKANTDLLTKVSAFGTSAEEIDTYIDKLNEVDTMQIDSNRESAEAQMATVNKGELMRDLKKHASKLRACLDIFYEGNEKQELEKLGITVK
ncbi:hypothetical protein [Saccharicrinis aurantiacus]|uniref:hypothetical protein n=1 Tax=Saccharicrinis aurantiacus TaxID=1849719 RepID=UPI00248FE23C|nr:hypothetical protein [Saccharicrinis aurantiacus]